MKTFYHWAGKTLRPNRHFSVKKKCKKSIFLPALLITSSLFAQDSLTLGSFNSFIKEFKNMQQTATKGTDTRLFLETPNGKLPFVININKTDFDGADVTIGEIADAKASTVYFSMHEEKLEGEIILQEEKLVYKYGSTENGEVYVKTVDIHDVICSDYEKLPEKPERDTKNAENIPAANSLAYRLQSYPQSPFVLYLDFDGEVVSRTRWAGGATINAQPMNLTASQIEEIWKLISEDFRAFNVNVTTDRSVYNATPRTRRQMQIFTTTKTAAPSAGGVAYLRSFGRNSDDSPCWTYNRGIRGAGETGSHEFGHTLGLNHDGISGGTAYYRGNSNWSTIMGWSASSSIGHWSRGEYQGANNREDDLGTIANSRNGFGYRNDLIGNTTQSAATLAVEGNGNISSNTGVIISRNDVDIYRFTTTGGTVRINGNAAASNPNLDILLKLYNAAGNEITSSNPSNSLSASIAQNLAAGTYFVSVEGAGRGNPTTSGYSNYSSIGEYSFSGNIPNNSTTICETAINLSVTNLTSTGATLRWSAVTGANDYQAWWRPIGGEWTNNTTSATSINIGALNPNTDYEFTVRTNCNTSESDFLRPFFQFSTTTVIVQCEAPTNLTSTNITQNSAVISWEAQTTANSYQVWWRSTNGTWQNKTVNVASTTLDNLTAGEQYQFTVRANCDGTFTDFASPWENFTTSEVVANCSAPTMLNASNVESNNATLNWRAQNAASSYQVWWRAINGDWTNATVTSNRITVENLTASTNYEFTVRANCNGTFTNYAATRGNFTTTNDNTGDNCANVASYSSNGNYDAGSRVKNAGAEYECKPFPFNGWCNGASWAYGPGTGTNWQDAWTLIGSCSSEASMSAMNQTGKGVVIMPNPVANQATIFLENGLDITGIVIIDAYGKTVLNEKVAASYNYNFNASTEYLVPGAYFVYVHSNNDVFMGRFIKK